MKERIQKVLANAGVSSRRSIEEMVRQGRIAVNGKIMTELPILANAEKDKIEVDETVRFKGEIGRAGVRADEQTAWGVYHQCGAVSPNAGDRPSASRLCRESIPLAGSTRKQKDCCC